MIRLGKGGVSLTCDICGDETDGFLDFEEAVAHKKAMEWISEKYQGEWEDICPECQEAQP